VIIPKRHLLVISANNSVFMRLDNWPWLIYMYQYSHVTPRLAGQNCKFVTFLFFVIPKSDTDAKKRPANVEFYPESLRAIFIY